MINALYKGKWRHFRVFAVFIVLAVVLRLFSFFPSVINHDESTYIVIADALLKGNVYWVDYIDTKPIGVFLLFALFKLVLGPSIFLYRLMTAVWLAGTAFLLYRVKIKLGSPAKAGVAAGVMYLFLNSIFTFYGVSPNTETYFGLFTIAAFFLLLNIKWPLVSAFEAGLLLGLGFLIKYVVAFDALALGLFLVWHFFRLPERRVQLFAQAVLLVVGFCLPLFAVWSYYKSIGAEETFLFFSFEVSSRYPVSAVFMDYITFVADFFGRFFPVTIFFLFILLRKDADKITKYFGLLWAGLILTVVLLPGKFFGHYFIQFMLPFCFVAGEVFGFQRQQLPKWLSTILQPKVGYTLLVLVILANLFLQKKDYLDKPDYPKAVANYITPKLEPNDQIYTGNYSQIIYHLTDRTSPIRYIHPSLFWEEKHIQALEVDRKQEFARLKAAAPKYVVVKDSLQSGEIREYVQANYLKVEQFGRRVFIYEKIRR